MRYKLFYSFDNEWRVARRGGRGMLDCDFGPDAQNELLWPPFRSFGKHY